MSHDPLPTIHGYKLIRALGRGTFGSVWEARGVGGFPAAIKFISLAHSGMLAEPELKALEESKELNHPHLIQTREVYLDDEWVIIVMEYAAGMLRERLQFCQTNGWPGIPPEELLHYMRQAGDALDYLHQRNKLHRDIKPDNLLITSTDSPHIKVGDCGLLRDRDRMTTLAAQGSPPYIAPEAWEARAVPGSDQFSLAASYVELRVGRLPFEGENPMGFAVNIGSKRPHLAGLQAAEALVVERALAKKAADRYPTCRDFVTALEDALSIRATAFRPLEPVGLLKRNIILIPPRINATHPIKIDAPALMPGPDITLPTAPVANRGVEASGASATECSAGIRASSVSDGKLPTPVVDICGSDPDATLRPDENREQPKITHPRLAELTPTTLASPPTLLPDAHNQRWDETLAPIEPSPLTQTVIEDRLSGAHLPTRGSSRFLILASVVVVAILAGVATIAIRKWTTRDDHSQKTKPGEPFVLVPAGFARADDAANQTIADKLYTTRLLKKVGTTLVFFRLVIPTKGPKPFYLMEEKVNNGLYALFANHDSEAAGEAWRAGGLAGAMATGCEGIRMPVLRMTRAQANACAGWLGGRLPSCQEWDDAWLSGALSSREGEGGDAVSDPQNAAIGRRDKGPRSSEEVPGEVNLLGIRDLSGNGYEWTNDDLLSAGRTLAILRGQRYTAAAPLTFRTLQEWQKLETTPTQYPETTSPYTGFRVVVDID